MAKWRHPPVYYTVAQVRFNPILNLESFIPSIQERLRKMNFPDYRRETIQQLVMAFSAGPDISAPAPTFTPQARAIFGTLKGSTSFVLESSALALQTVEYDTFETFCDQLIQGLEVVHDVIGLAYTERVGLRYLDAVTPAPDESVFAYLTDKVQGISAQLNGTLKHSFTETLVEVGDCKLLSRTIIQHGNVGLPPELTPSQLKIAPRFADFTGMHAILDNDAFQESRDVFSLEQTQQTLHKLHDEIRKSFKATYTEHAENKWK